MGGTPFGDLEKEPAMKTQGLWIDIEFCTGCLACEAACRQEHGFSPEEFGIKVLEQVLNGGRTFNYVPIPTDLCDLCARRTGVENKAPACVHHCMAQVMRFGPVEELALHMKDKPRSVIWAPRPRPTGRRPFDAVMTGEGGAGDGNSPGL